MKLSKYTILKEINGERIFFNTRTCALAVVNDEFEQVVKDIQMNQYNESLYDEKLIQAMKNSGCIVDDSLQEIDEVEFKRNSFKYQTNSLGLTITPTLNCNFRCQYCFENHIIGNMSVDTQEALLKFITAQLSTIKKLNIVWFGGEPLLAKNIIYTMSEKIIALCKKHSVIYAASMVTNGSLFSDEDIEPFKRYNIGSVQITIDGPKEVHDKRRRTCNGKSAFDDIINNINKMLNNDINVSVRINLDEDNIDSIDELIDVLQNRINKYSNLMVSFGKVSVFTEVCKSIEGDCLSDESFSMLRLSLYKKLLAKGFSKCKMLSYPQLKYNNCCADYMNSFVVDVNGNLYKCWNQVGRVEEKCGDVFKGCDVKSQNFLKWVQWNPLKFTQCKECNLLPICMGGCTEESPDKTVRKPACSSIKYNLDDILTFYYNCLKK